MAFRCPECNKEIKNMDDTIVTETCAYDPNNGWYKLLACPHCKKEIWLGERVPGPFDGTNKE